MKLMLSFIVFAQLFCVNELFAQSLTQMQVYRAYTKVFGYVRFFHPSDEVAALHAEKFAYYGVGKLQNIRDTKTLRDTLTNIFKPIAPSIQFYLKGEKPQNLATYNKKDSLQLVFWQHKGLGLRNFFDRKQEVYKSIRINTWKDTIFSQYPQYGEVIEQEISPNLFCKIPLALYKDKIGTLPRNEQHVKIYQSLKTALDSMKVDTLSSTNPRMRVANVVVFWNTINYFYPYFKEVGLNWDNELVPLLQEVIQPHDDISCWKILIKTVGKLQDAHAFASPPETVELFQTFPFKTAWVGEKYLITQTQDSTFLLGDEVVELANQPIKKFIDNHSVYWQGSMYLRNVRGGDYFLGWGKPNTTENIVLRRKVNNKTTQLSTKVSRSIDYLSSPSRPSREIAEGIFYLNLTTDSLEYLKTFLPKLQKAKGVIIEMRGYPEGNNLDFLSYLSPTPLQSTKWNVPQIYSPNQYFTYEKVVGH